MAKYIGLFSDTINDIEINGFAIMTDKEMENFEDLANSITWEFAYPIGDEELVYINGDDLLTKIEFKEITVDEFKSLEKVFNGDYGTFIGETFLNTIIEEEDEDIDVDDEDEEDYGYFN